MNCTCCLKSRGVFRQLKLFFRESGMTIPDILPENLVNFVQQHPNAVVLDVREDDEVAICQISGSIHIPMNLIPLRYNELPDVPIVVYCHHGVRSLNVARYLQYIGFDEVYNLRGGIDAYALAVASDMLRY